MKIRFGFSWASLIPYSLYSITMVTKWAEKAGAEFAQGIPLRRMTGGERFPLPVLYKEKAWNPVWTFGQARRHQPGAEGVPSCLNDWIASPNSDKCAEIFSRLPGREISHHFDNAPDRLVELCPELDLSPGAIAGKCRAESFNLVLDTEHLTRDWRDFDPRKDRPHPFHMYPGGIPGTVKVLAPHIQVVHVKSVTDDMDRMIIECLFRADHRDEIDFIAEYKPILRGPWAVRRHMREFLTAMRKHVVDALLASASSGR